MSVQDWTCSVCGGKHPDSTMSCPPTFTLKEPGVVTRPSVVSREDFDNLFESHCRIGKQRDELVLQIERLKTMALQDKAINASVQADRDNALRLVDSMKKVVEAARVMRKHQEDRHELSSCCNDAMPTASWFIKKSLEELDATEKRKDEGVRPVVPAGDSGADVRGVSTDIGPAPYDPSHSRTSCAYADCLICFPRGTVFPKGTYRCQICGKDTPHTHDDRR